MDEDGRERSAQSRALAEQALVGLLHALSGTAISPIVLGGLVPETLTRDRPLGTPRHLGTGDVDVLIITHLEEAAELGTVERALIGMDFRPADADGWRWRGTVEGHAVVIEFLCDLAAAPSGRFIRARPDASLSAQNLRGTGYVALDFVEETLVGRTATGEEVTVRARFAGLGGYLLSKCAAVHGRAWARDYYDFAYVLIHNSRGGPSAAAEVLLEERFADARRALASTFHEVRERFRRTQDDGPARYAEEVRRADLDADPARLRADAVAAASEFFHGLGA